MAHKSHPACVFTSKAACERARRAALGPCREMIDEDKSCKNLGTDEYDGKAYCGQHLNSAVLAADRVNREAKVRADRDGRADTFLAWVADHPSVWDMPPR